MREDYRDILRINGLQRALQIHGACYTCKDGKERFRELTECPNR